MTVVTFKTQDILGNRYEYDARFKGPTWVQIDTWQDASYFGIWTNPAERKIATFCEGDVTVQVAQTDDEYVRILREALGFYDAPKQKSMIDVFNRNASKQKLIELGLADRLH